MARSISAHPPRSRRAASSCRAPRRRSGSVSSVTIAPSARKITRSAYDGGVRVVRDHDDGLAELVAPSARRKPSTSAPERESRLPVGSSAKMTSGRDTSARAQATRCCWPPESWVGRCPSRSRRPTVSMTRSNHARSGLRPAIASGSRMFSSAVSVGSRLNCWKMKPTCSRRSFVSAASDRPVSSVSPTNTSPRVTVSRPARQCMSVDLPEPDGPMIAVYSRAPQLDAHATQRGDLGFALCRTPSTRRPRGPRRSWVAPGSLSRSLPPGSVSAGGCPAHHPWSASARQRAST